MMRAVVDGSTERDAKPASPAQASTRASPAASPSGASLDRSGRELEVTLEGEAEPLPAAAGPKGAWSPGQRIGRYIVTARIGAGAMGVVYAAYDPELDRRIALKVLRPKSGRTDTSQGRGRLMREAQALARLRHPNVVAIHDVGTHDDRVYLAMEFVDGEPLTRWLELGARSLSQRLAVFAAAARGLHAAHQANLVHRDFKPDNVVVASDGTVRVLDFGLARATGETASQVVVSASDTPATGPNPIQASATGSVSGSGSGSSPGAALDLSGSRSSLDTELTQTGGVIGTPAYMSPEQHLGEAVTAASDQFSFCVALWEAVYGERPFGGDSLAAVAFAVTQGKLRAPPTGSRVPTWLRRVLERGLSPRPEERWPSMQTFVDALGDDPITRRRNRRIGVVGTSLAAGAIAYATWGKTRPQDPCTAAGNSIDEHWNDEVRADLASAFKRTGLGFAGTSAARVSGSLDDWSARWRNQARQNCVATRVEKTQSESTLDLRHACLARARGEVSALISAFRDADETTVERAAEAVAELPDLAACADTRRLTSTRAPKDSTPEARALELELDQVKALLATGAYKRGIESALALEERVKDIDDPSITMRFSGLLGTLRDIEEENEKAAHRFEAAYAAAEHLGDDWARARWSMRLVGAWGYGLAKHEPAQAWLHVADGVVTYLGSPPELEAELQLERGTLSLKQGDYDEAIAALQSAVERLEAEGRGPSDVYLARQRLAVALREKGHNARAQAVQEELLAYVLKHEGADHPRAATVYGSLGNTAFMRGDYDTAVAHYEKALAIVAQAFGEDSPRYHDRLNNYAAALWGQGEYAAAEATHRKILAFNRERFGEGDLRLTPSYENLGNCLISQRRFEEAKAAFESSLAIRKEVYGLDHPSTAMSEMNLGVALYQLGQLDAAAALYAHTLEVWRDKLGEEHADLGMVYSNLGDLALARGQSRRAAEFQRRALALLEPTYGADNSELGWPLTGLGLAELSGRRIEPALAAFERARRLREGVTLPPGERARMDFGYARALVAADRELPSGLVEATLADAKANPELAAEIEAAARSWRAR